MQPPPEHNQRQGDCYILNTSADRLVPALLAAGYDL